MIYLTDPSTVAVARLGKWGNSGSRRASLSTSQPAGYQFYGYSFHRWCHRNVDIFRIMIHRSGKSRYEYVPSLVSGTRAAFVMAIIFLSLGATFLVVRLFPRVLMSSSSHVLVSDPSTHGFNIGKWRQCSSCSDVGLRFGHTDNDTIWFSVVPTEPCVQVFVDLMLSWQIIGRYCIVTVSYGTTLAYHTSLRI